MNCGPTGQTLLLAVEMSVDLDNSKAVLFPIGTEMYGLSIQWGAVERQVDIHSPWLNAVDCFTLESMPITAALLA
jgi:hypothetical protein